MDKRQFPGSTVHGEAWKYFCMNYRLAEIKVAAWLVEVRAALLVEYDRLRRAGFSEHSAKLTATLNVCRRQDLNRGELRRDCVQQLLDGELALRRNAACTI